jgi:hypothetical protein
MLLTVSLAYKESSNCRLEFNYAHQLGLPWIPLMMERDYQAKGWLGLLLGTRLWYGLWDAEKDDDATFAARLDPVVRQIGDRGRQRGTAASAASAVSEGVPPLAAAAPAPAPAPAPPAALPQAPSHEPTAAQAAAAALALPPPPPPGQVPPPGPSTDGAAGAHVGCSLAELGHFMEQQQRLLCERDARSRAEKAELEAKFEAKLEAQRLEMNAKRVAFSDEQLTALQSRLEALHAAKLITSDELFLLEDLCADIIELGAEVGPLTTEMACTNRAVRQVSKLVALSSRIPGDAALARQLRRSHVQASPTNSLDL